VRLQEKQRTSFSGSNRIVCLLCRGPEAGSKNFSNLTFRKANGARPKLNIADVAVSIQLDIISENIAKEKVGGVVLQTSKAVAAKSWRDEHSACVASLVWMLASKHLTDFGDVDRALCYSADMFAKKVKQAPISYKKRLKDVEASCAEISSLWSSVIPPNGFEVECLSYKTKPLL
jgi:hypothetical protein